MIFTILISKYGIIWQTHKKFENSHFLSLFSKNIRYQDLQYFILMLLTKNFGSFKYFKALGERVLGLEDWINIHVFFTQTLCIYTEPTFRGSKKGSLCFSLKIFLQKGQKNQRKPAYWTNLLSGGPLDSGHPVIAVSLILEKAKKRWCSSRSQHLF